MKGKPVYLGILLLLVSAMVIGGCGETGAAPTPAPGGQSSPPSDPVGARDAVLAYLAQNYGSDAPTSGLAWTQTRITPEGLVGSETYEYTAGDWVITVQYPVVAPENVIYTVVASNQATGFQWEGTVDAQLHVTETSPGS